jgi:surfeit locus 1 family protein
VRQVRFLLGPRWLLSHLLVVLLIVAMVDLGFWQLRRLDERREHNALVEGREDQPVVPVDDLVQPGDGGDAVGAARFRTVTATGTYDADATIEVRNRTQDGVAGVWMLTPLVLDSGDRVGIVRGFVPLGANGDPHPTAPPDGQVTVTGAVADPTKFDGTAPRDVDDITDQTDVLPAVVLLDRSDPGEPEALTDSTDDPSTAIAKVPPPELGEGPHFSYAVQWFIFTTIALVGYPLILRRVIQRRGKEVDDHPTPEDLDRELAELLGPKGPTG